MNGALWKKRCFLGLSIAGVVAGTSAFVPPTIPTVDAFETPKTIVWCLTLASICWLGGTVSASRKRTLGEWAAWALLAWMLLRTLVAWPVPDVSVLIGWMLPPALYLAGCRLQETTTRPLLRACLWIGIAQAGLMVLQRFGIDPFFAATTTAEPYLPGRMIGTVGYHNQAVDLLAVCASLGIALVGSAAVLVGALAVVAVLAAYRTRATMSRAAWSMIGERPLTGWGSGAFAFQYMERVADVMPLDKNHEDLTGVVYAREPHNDFLHLWCEFGLIGPKVDFFEEVFNVRPMIRQKRIL